MKTGTESKMKFKVLQRRLSLRHYECIGLLESLWQTTIHNAPAGDIGRLTNEEIAAAIDWQGDADELVSTLVACKWLDEDSEFRLIVHDWSEHAPNHVKGGLANGRRQFADVVATARKRHVEAKNDGSLATSLAPSLATSLAPSLATSSELPSQATSHQTKPNQTNSNLTKPNPTKAAGAASRRRSQDRQATIEDADWPPELDTPECRSAWADWLAYKRDRREPYKSAKSIGSQLARLAAMGPARMVAAITFSMAQNWRGIFEEESRNGNRNGKHTIGQGQSYADDVARLSVVGRM